MTICSSKNMCSTVPSIDTYVKELPANVCTRKTIRLLTVFLNYGSVGNKGVLFVGHVISAMLPFFTGPQSARAPRNFKEPLSLCSRKILRYGRAWHSTGYDFAAVSGRHKASQS